MARCANAEEHDAHWFLGEVVTTCLGTTTCGTRVHTPHTTVKQEDVYCPGLCFCGFRKTMHGPGEHK